MTPQTTLLWLHDVGGDSFLGFTNIPKVAGKTWRTFGAQRYEKVLQNIRRCDKFSVKILHVIAYPYKMLNAVLSKTGNS